MGVYRERKFSWGSSDSLKAPPPLSKTHTSTPVILKRFVHSCYFHSSHPLLGLHRSQDAKKSEAWNKISHYAKGREEKIISHAQEIP